LQVVDDKNQPASVTRHASGARTDRFEQQGLATGFVHAHAPSASSSERCGSRRASSERTPAREFVDRGQRRRYSVAVAAPRSTAHTRRPSTQPPRTTCVPSATRAANSSSKTGLPDAHFPANEHDLSGVGYAAQRVRRGAGERGTSRRDEIRGPPLASPHSCSLWADTFQNVPLPSRRRTNSRPLQHELIRGRRNWRGNFRIHAEGSHLRARLHRAR